MCKEPIGLEYLVAYWLGELPAAAEEKVEVHFLGCAHCAGRLEWLAALADGVRAAVRAGRFGMVVSAPFVEALKAAGFRLREYPVEAGGKVSCTMAADDDAVVSRLRAPLGGVARVDVVQRVRAGGEDWPEIRLEDVPFDPRAGEVLVLLPPALLRKMPAHTAVTRLVAVGAAGEAPIGEYTFAHTPP
jgi:hypothetical protein